MVSWELPAPATDVGLNADEPTPPGRPVRDSATLPVKPLRVPTVTVYVVVSPAGTVLEAGAAATVKFGGGGITRVAYALRLVVPFVPVSVSRYEPGARSAVVVTSSWALPLPPETTAGVKLHLACAAESPARLSVTASAKPFTPATETVYVAVPPGVVVAVEGDADIVKSGIVVSHRYAAKASSRPRP